MFTSQIQNKKSSQLLPSHVWTYMERFDGLAFFFFPSDQNNTTLQAIKIQMSHTQTLILQLFGLPVTVKAKKTSRWSLQGSLTLKKMS